MLVGFILPQTAKGPALSKIVSPRAAAAVAVAAATVAAAAIAALTTPQVLRAAQHTAGTRPANSLLVAEPGGTAARQGLLAVVSRRLVLGPYV